MEQVKIVLPFPCSVNNYYVKNRKGGVYISKKGKDYREKCNEEIRIQLAGLPIITERITVIVILYPPDARDRDLDNYMKCLLDALTQDYNTDRLGLWIDDKIIDQLLIFRGTKQSGGFVELYINEAGPVISPENSELVISEFL